MSLIRVFFSKGCPDCSWFLLNESAFICNSLIAWWLEYWADVQLWQRWHLACANALDKGCLKSQRYLYGISGVNHPLNCGRPFARWKLARLPVDDATQVWAVTEETADLGPSPHTITRVVHKRCPLLEGVQGLYYFFCYCYFNKTIWESRSTSNVFTLNLNPSSTINWTKYYDGHFDAGESFRDSNLHVRWLRLHLRLLR